MNVSRIEVVGKLPGGAHVGVGDVVPVAVGESVAVEDGGTVDVNVEVAVAVAVKVGVELCVEVLVADGVLEG